MVKMNQYQIDTWTIFNIVKAGTLESTLKGK
jgi:hypothetical protein